MIAAFTLAAALLAPAGVTATIQGNPVCLPVVAQPGHSYPLSVSGTGSLALSVVPDTGGLHASLRQVPASWVNFTAAGPGSVALTLAIPGNAAPGAYWSNIEAGTQSQPQSGAGVSVTNRTAATTGLVFAVGPSSVPPPPCDALALAQSTGKYPPWPTKAFATTSWKQVYARLKGGPVTPDGGPTAAAPGSAAARSAVRIAPVAAVAAAPASGHITPALAKFLGWAVLIAIIGGLAGWFLKLLGGK
jgi:hypothetical protein